MTVRDKVEELLTQIPQCRDNDRLLIAYVLKDLYHIQNTFDIALSKEIDGNIYESIRRMRQKLQETNPLLESSARVKAERKKKEQAVREEMRGV